MFLSEQNCDVVFLTEHWLVKEEELSTCISDYTVASCFPRTNHVHGEALISTRANIEFETLKHVNDSSIEMEIEMASAKIPKYDIIAICVYRPPVGNIDVFVSRIDHVLDSIG
ncbi:hypothetical protein HHI36_004108 [Cryptolaemus montrouzieri]|uniref:Uncharacterized protein n=1 Tax=Cryptolaemus montrouzieri TaxID=559131 RepID=A0ABD2NRT3_9CUCU